VFKIWRFEGGIGVPKHGGSLNSTGAGLLNHQTSKIRLNSIWMKISLWIFKIRGFEGGIGVSKLGRPLNSTVAGLLNHQTSKFSLFCLMNQNLLMRVLNLRFRREDWAPQRAGNLRNAPGPWFQISEHLYLAFFAYRVKICWWVFAIWGFERGIGPPTFWGPQNFTGALISNHQTSKFSLFCLKSENMLVGVCSLRFWRWNWTLNVWGTSKFSPGPQF
jgi:hypothetical protein